MRSGQRGVSWVVDFGTASYGCFFFLSFYMICTQMCILREKYIKDFTEGARLHWFSYTVRISSHVRYIQLLTLR
jgi:hypothetical protein